MSRSKAALLMVFTIFAWCVPAESTNAFFAMDTIARGKPELVVPILKELGYDGLGGQCGDGAMAAALKSAGLRFFNGYLTLRITAGQPALTDKLRVEIDAMKGYDAALWLAIAEVRQDDKPVAKSSPEGDPAVLVALRELADYAQSRGIKIVLYPHAGSWLERVDDAVRLADKLNRAEVGVTFNLCHWLKVEGVDRDPAPVLKAALPRLMFVTICGADTGDTRKMNWDRLIQPLDQGTYDVKGFMKPLRDTGYRGPVGFQGYGIKDEPREVLRRTMDAWKKFSK